MLKKSHLIFSFSSRNEPLVLFLQPSRYRTFELLVWAVAALNQHGTGIVVGFVELRNPAK